MIRWNVPVLNLVKSSKVLPNVLRLLAVLAVLAVKVVLAVLAVKVVLAVKAPVVAVSTAPSLILRQDGLAAWSPSKMA